MDQNQSSWQPISSVLDQKISVEDTNEPEATKDTVNSVLENAIPEPRATSSPITDQNLNLLAKLVEQLTQTTESLNLLVSQLRGAVASSKPLNFETPFVQQESQQKFQNISSQDKNAARVLEGVFDGTRMVGADGAFYPVPPNYASKSKLVEGDLMKLTITPTGAFIFKQIGPIKRKRVIGELLQHKDGDTIMYDVLAQDRVYHVLSAAITYFKGEANDEVSILVPENSPSKWAAVEYIVKKSVIV